MAGAHDGGVFRDPSAMPNGANGGAMSGAIKFQLPAGKSASGPLATMADFFSGVTCEFEDLNPVKLGRGAEVTFNFPAKLTEVSELWGEKMTRAAAMTEATGDWADHYSQAAIYLRLNGQLPPTAKKP